MRILVTGTLALLIIALGCVGIWTTDYTFNEKLVVSVCSVLSIVFYITAEVIDAK